jgi:PPOX class probable F420-dependent enzyme
MPSRRDLIRMSDGEVSAYLAEFGHTLNVASIGPDGRPHLSALWYGWFGNGDLGFWTFTKSQKILNLRRDPRVTCLVESGDVYDELRGVQLIASATVSEEPADLLEIGRSVLTRYPPPGTPPGVMIDASLLTDEVVLQAAAKRSAVRVTIEKVVSWDHRKLAGLY